MSMSKCCASLVLAVTAVSQAAAGDDSGPYVSANVGNANHAENVGLHPPGIAQMVGRSDSHDTGWSLNVGYRFSRHFALELGYLDLGEIEASVADASGASDARADFSFSTEGVTFAMVGTFPIGNWEPYLKAGVLFSENELDYSGTVSGNAFAATVKHDAEDALFGGGVRYAFGERWAAQFELNYVMEAGDRGSGEADYVTWFLGVTRRF